LATVATESLIEIKRESLKPRGKNTQDNNDSDGYWDKYSPRWDKPTIYKDTKDEPAKKISCFLYNEPHWVFECPKHREFNTLVTEEEW